MPYNPQDFKNIDIIKKGFINTIFQIPTLIVTHLSFIFGDANITLCDKNCEPNTFFIVCESEQGSHYPYRRVFKFSYIIKENGCKRITNVEEL